MKEQADDRTSDKQKSSDMPGGRAAERLRDFLEKRLPPEEVEAELQRQTNLQQESEKKPGQGELGPEKQTKPEK